MPMMPITLKSGEEANLDVYTFNGDETAAQKAINDYCKTHESRFESYGYGYSALIIEGTSLETVRDQGISVMDVLKACGLNPEDYGHNPRLLNLRGKLAHHDFTAFKAAIGRIPEGKTEIDLRDNRLEEKTRDTDELAKFLYETGKTYILGNSAYELQLHKLLSETLPQQAMNILYSFWKTDNGEQRRHGARELLDEHVSQYLAAAPKK